MGDDLAPAGQLNALAQLAELSPGAMLIVDSQGRIIAVNRHAERVFRQSREALVGLAAEELIGHGAPGADAGAESPERPPGVLPRVADAAHELNNLLSVVVGNAEFLSGRLTGGSPQYEEVTEILKASERAATLTRELLALSRSEPPRAESA